MGEIICSRRHPRETKKIVVEILLHQEEFKQLQGEVENICLFSENMANVPSKVSLRGRNEVTKYFLIPRQLRKKMTITGAISCQRIENAGRHIFVYVIDPLKGPRNTLATTMDSPA